VVKRVFDLNGPDGSRGRQIVGRVLFVLSTSFLLVGAGLLLTRGNAEAAIVPVAIVVIAGIAVLFAGQLRKRVGHPRFTKTIDLDVSVETALEWAKMALQTLAPDEEVIGDRRTFNVSVEPARSWRSWGERVTVTVSPSNGGSHLVVDSECLSPQLIDSGKNRANVEAVLRWLSSTSEHIGNS